MYPSRGYTSDLAAQALALSLNHWRSTLWTVHSPSEPIACSHMLRTSSLIHHAQPLANPPLIFPRRRALRRLYRRPLTARQLAHALERRVLSTSPTFTTLTRSLGRSTRHLLSTLRWGRLIRHRLSRIRASSIRHGSRTHRCEVLRLRLWLWVLLAWYISSPQLLRLLFWDEAEAVGGWWVQVVVRETAGRDG